MLLLAFGFLPAIVVAIRFFGYRRTQGMLGRLSPSPAPAHQPNADLSQLRRYGAATNMAANRCLVHANCLPRSVCLWWFLRFLGYPSRIRFGVMKQQGRLQAHAWVECNGEPLNDQADISERFHPLDYAEALRLEIRA